MGLGNGGSEWVAITRKCLVGITRKGLAGLASLGIDLFGWIYINRKRLVGLGLGEEGMVLGFG